MVKPLKQKSSVFPRTMQFLFPDSFLLILKSYLTATANNKNPQDAITLVNTITDHAFS
jgi:hypothetical protein